MARRRTQAELRAEFLRLVDCWPYVVEEETALRMKGDPSSAPFFSDLPTKDDLIAQFDRREFPASSQISGLKQALNDFALGLRADLMAGLPEAASFLDRYKAETGRGFFLDIGDPIQSAKLILRNGTIADETEFYLLTELVSEVDQTLLSPNDIEKATILLAEFEAALEKPNDH